MTKDTLTTIIGGIGAAAAAAGPALSAAQNQSLHQADYFQLIFAVAMSVLGYFTNKKEKVEEG